MGFKSGDWDRRCKTLICVFELFSVCVWKYEASSSCWKLSLGPSLYLLVEIWIEIYSQKPLSHQPQNFPKASMIHQVLFLLCSVLLWPTGQTGKLVTQLKNYGSPPKKGLWCCVLWCIDTFCTLVLVKKEAAAVEQDAYLVYCSEQSNFCGVCTLHN